MNFDLTEDQLHLRESVRNVLEKECSPALVRGVYERGEVPAQPWQSACELGWLGLVIPEASGGLGLSFVELALLIEEHGRALASGPFVSTLTQLVPAVLETGDAVRQRDLLSSVATGSSTGAIAIAGPRGDFLEADDALVATPEAGGSWRLDGVRHFVTAGAGSGADEVVAAARIDRGDGVGLFVLPRDAFEADVFEAILDPSRPLATLRFEGVQVASQRVLGEPGASAAALQRCLDWAVTGTALEMLGCAQSLFDQTLAYAKQREQFDRPIGSFQATQHKFANLFVALEKARATAYFAAMTIAEDDPRRTLAASMAKVAAGECQRLMAKEGIQIHGGVGYTWEQDVHLYVKRLKTCEALFGTTAIHRQRIADLLQV